MDSDGKAEPQAGDPAVDPAAVAGEATEAGTPNPGVTPAIPPAPFDPTASPALMELIRRRVGDDPDEVADLLERLSELVQFILDANERMNLTGDNEPRLFWERHIEDSLLAAERIVAALGGEPGENARILDVGSGAGIPGLVWAVLWPQVRVDLLESRQKRAQFLTGAAESLQLELVRVFSDRAETFGHLPAHRERYDLVTARGVASLPTLLEFTLPFVRVGGAVAAIKSAQIEAELNQAGAALRTLGAGERPPELLPYTRADGKACQVCLVRKLTLTPRAYPRPANLPERLPLLPA